MSKRFSLPLAILCLGLSSFLSPLVAHGELINLIDPRAEHFKHFSYNRTELDFCINEEAIYTAEVQLDEDGLYYFQYTLLVEDEVVPMLPGNGRVLSSNEVELLILHLDITLDNLNPGIDAHCPLWDPCRIVELKIDKLSLTDDLCAQPHIPHDQLERMLNFLEDLRFERIGSTTLNGDTNGDNILDISDVIYLLSHLFLGDPPPVEITCFLPNCFSPDFERRLENGDVNGDNERDITDAVALLSWLFLDGEKPLPACFCEIDNETYCNVVCSEEDPCVPDGHGGRICVSELPDCEAIKQHYHFLVSEYATTCDDSTLPCVLLRGHCGISLGGCYHVSVAGRVTQDDLNALANRFLDFVDQGEQGCIDGVCDCAGDPTFVGCEEGKCIMSWERGDF